MADVSAFAGLSFCDFAGIAIPPELAHLAAWRARIAARPSVAAA